MMPRAWLVGALLLLAPGARAAADLDLEVTLEPATRRLEAVAELPPGGRTFQFALHDSLSVRAVRAPAGQPVAASIAGSRGDGTRIWRIAALAGVDRVRIAYGGTLPATETGRDHRQVLQRLPPMAAAAGSFLAAGSGWYPQPPLALFSYRVRVSVPGEQRAVVPGSLRVERLPRAAGDRYEAEFEFAQPTDGVDLMAAPWRVRERLLARAGVSPLRLRTYFPPALDAEPGLAEGYLADSARYLERYGGLIGAYPYDAFSIVASPLPTGLGMPTLTYLGVDVLRLPFIRATSLGHEVLHNWWGNGVYVDARMGNWSEGLTTFLADYAYAEERSAAAAHAMRLAWLRDAAALPASEQPALRDFRSRRHGAEATVGYGKAAMFFLALRDRIGAVAFAQGLREFWQAHRFRHASWDDLRRAFERAAGGDLRGVFAQWLDSRQLPAFSVEDAVASRSASGHRLRLTLRQTSPPLASRLPVEISGGAHSVTRWVDLTGERRLVDFDLDFPPASIRIDPQARTWRRLHEAELPLILRRWIGALQPRWLVVGGDAAFREAAATVVGRFFERPAALLAVGDLRPALTAGEAVMIVGTPAEVDAALLANGLPQQAQSLGGNATRGSARVWTVDSGPLLAVAARDAAALRSLARPLPHYGGQSWLVFDGAQASERGLWPAVAPVFAVRGEAPATRRQKPGEGARGSAVAPRSP
ncbi:M1 family aminopeptidase [Accumulibacter sp.]|uniref:M1 family metallopeptidase n=1 Tax=Accumulibacter sp. TaxID=2053492 RepID=UPI0025F72E27|nr:M1 family aminopeptidase [Accumulibacter sp.]MCM8611091.1 M1 family peptidase [Accumulibacter sp.]MCM8636205.1 M1 family peptidase [Accumulibacter sp.]MCM8640604.1 M1 family peptidase [Accumulibacter sp.]